MIASSNCQKGQETLPDTSVPFVVVTLLSRDVTLSTAPQVVLEPRQCGPSGCPCPSPCKMSGAHPGEEAISVSRPISRTGGVFWKSRQEPCSSLTADERIPSWAQITHPELAAVSLQAGWWLTGHLALASEAGSPAEMHTSPMWTAGPWRSPNLVARLEAGPEGSPSCRDVVTACWLEAILCFLTSVLSQLKFQVLMKHPPLFQMVSLFLSNSLKT